MREFILDQLKEDELNEQLSIEDMLDPFTSHKHGNRR